MKSSLEHNICKEVETVSLPTTLLHNWFELYSFLGDFT
jgi:hypothetical protein